MVDSYDDVVGDADEDRPIEDFVIAFGATRAWADGVCGQLEYRYSPAGPVFGNYPAVVLEPVDVRQCGVGGDGGDFPHGRLAVITEEDGVTLSTGHLAWVFEPA